MRKIISFVLVTTMALLVFGCAGIPKEEELQQLNKAQLEALLPGRTLTFAAEYGRWAEYFMDGATGVGKAWGSWGEEKADYEYKVDQNGEICWTFTGGYDWAEPEQKYCSLIFSDQPGMYYAKVTENTWKRQRIGKRLKVEIIEGDKYGLASN